MTVARYVISRQFFGGLVGAHILLLTSVCVAESPEAASVVDVESLIRLPNLTNVAIAPNGRDVAYVVARPDPETNAYKTTLHVVGVLDKRSRTLDPPAKPWSTPYPRVELDWSPDGRYLSYLGDVDGVPQLFILASDGTDGRQITSVACGISAYEWAPDADSLAFVACETLVDKPTAPTVQRVGLEPNAPRLWVQGLEADQPRFVSPADHYVYSFNWSPNGRALVYSAAHDANYMSMFRTGLYVVPGGGGVPQQLMPPTGANLNPQWSPNGQWISFITSSGEQSIMAVLSLAVVPSAGGASRNLTREYQYYVSEAVWSPRNQELYFTADSGTSDPREGMFAQYLYRIGLDGIAERISDGQQVVSDIDIDRSGHRLTFRLSHAASMGDVHVLDTNGASLRRLTTIEPDQQEFTWASLEPVHWASFDGAEIWGLLMLPPGQNRVDGPFPLLVYVHGGPIGGFRFGIYPQFTHTIGQLGPYPLQALASAGIAVFLPNPRGGNGYGDSGYRAIIGAWGDVDFQDIETGVDALIDLGIADRDRLGVAGGSYGGYMTNWIVTQTNRYRAASSWAGIADVADLFALSDAGDFTLDYFGPPWLYPAVYREKSPLTHSARVSTPLLLQHGQQDNRVPPSQAREFFKYLKGQGKSVCLEIYPENGHVTSQPSMQLEVQRRNYLWFTRWLIGPEPSPSDMCP